MISKTKQINRSALSCFTTTVYHTAIREFMRYCGSSRVELLCFSPQTEAVRVNGQQQNPGFIYKNKVMNILTGTETETEPKQIIKYIQLEMPR